jgi:DNA polymerase III epsilon subunit family exonuclease
VSGDGSLSNEDSVTEVPFVAFDFETTGLYPARDQIVEFGAVRFRGRTEEATFDALVDPGIDISGEAGTVSGITPEMVQGKPSVEDTVPSFIDFLEGSVLVAHNAEFDLGFLRAALQAAGQPDIKNPIVDTQALAQRAFPRLRSYGLQNLVTELNLPTGTAHRALDDARMCMHLFLSCAEALSFMGELSLGEVLT